MNKEKLKANNIQLILIYLLCAILIMVIVTGVTFAWYTRNVSDKLGVTLSHPVEIYREQKLMLNLVLLWEKKINLVRLHMLGLS